MLDEQKEAEDVEIYGTLGPSCGRMDTLEQMFRLGMTGMRLNLSHVTLHEAAEQIETLHQAARRCGAEARLLIDMQGPELRIGTLEAHLTLTEGDTVTLGGGGIPVPEIVLPHLLPGQEVLLDDGKLLLRTEANHGDHAAATVLRGGTLQSRKSIALPGAAIRPPALQKRIAAQCRAAGKSFMVVTQMLASMEQNPVPTRAEVSDIFNAVLDGAASVMVTGETAVGKYPVEVIRYLANTAHEAEQFIQQ